jgi:hypothetical protein
MPVAMLRHAWSIAISADVRDSVGRDRQRAAGSAPQIVVAVAVSEDTGEIGGRDADEDAGCRRRHRGQRLAGVLDRLVGDLQQQSLLRIEPLGLGRRDVEELAIEIEHPVDEPAPFRAREPGRLRDRAVERLSIPAIGRDLANGAPPVEQELPQGGRIADVAGEPAAEPYNCYFHFYSPARLAAGLFVVRLRPFGLRDRARSIKSPCSAIQ